MLAASSSFILLTFASMLVPWMFANVHAETPSSRPNILLIVADDMGDADLGCYGGEMAII